MLQTKVFCRVMCQLAVCSEWCLLAELSKVVFRALVDRGMSSAETRD